MVGFHQYRSVGAHELHSLDPISRIVGLQDLVEGQHDHIAATQLSRCAQGDAHFHTPLIASRQRLSTWAGVWWWLWVLIRLGCAV